MKKTIVMMITGALLCGGSAFAQVPADNNQQETNITAVSVQNAAVSEGQPQAVAVQAEPAKVQQIQRLMTTVGVIEEIDDNRFVIKGDGDHMTVELTINDDTYLLNGVTGEILTWDMLSEGDAVAAYYTPVLTRSIPPQGQATALVIGKETKRGMFVGVQSIVREDEYGITFLSHNEDMEILIPKDDRGQMPNIKTGMNLLVWSDMMTMSLPAQLTATRSQVLPPTYDMHLDKDNGKIWIRGKEAGSIIMQDDTMLLSLRSAAEALGYQTDWHDSGVIVLSRGMEYYVMQIGSKDYGKQKMRVQLHDVPQMINGTTYVPVTVFSQLLGLRIGDFS